MKIINNTDINNLITFAKKNLGIYKLVYKEQKKIYFSGIVILLISVCSLILYISLIILHLNTFLQNICCFCCLTFCFISLGLLIYTEKKTKNKHLKIQEIRYDLLKEYYINKNYSIKNLKIINEQLKKRIEKIEKQKITILVIISVMILPVWEIFVQSYFNEFSSIKIFKFAIFLIVFSFIILAIARFFNKTLYIYEENFYIVNNVAIIENLIYLNDYIIQEKEELLKNGRRRRRR